jgi:hypothetical protein
MRSCTRLRRSSLRLLILRLAKVQTSIPNTVRELAQVPRHVVLAADKGIPNCWPSMRGLADLLFIHLPGRRNRADLAPERHRQGGLFQRYGFNRCETGQFRRRRRVRFLARQHWHVDPELLALNAWPG